MVSPHSALLTPRLPISHLHLPCLQCPIARKVAVEFHRVKLTMRQFFIGMFCGAAVLFVAMHYHVVRGNEGVVLVPKISNNLSDVYVDIREFDLPQWEQHKPLAAAIMKSNQAHLLENSAHRSFGNAVRELVDNLFRSEA